jgi:hypothetical protein
MPMKMKLKNITTTFKTNLTIIMDGDVINKIDEMWNQLGID